MGGVIDESKADGGAQGGEAHEGAGSKAGKRQCDAGAIELLAGVLGDLLVDVFGGRALQVFLLTFGGGLLPFGLSSVGFWDPMALRRGL